MTNNKKLIGATALAALTTYIASHEGLRTTAYKDPGKPEIATICYGETLNVRFGDAKTTAQCLEMLQKRIPDFYLPVINMMPGLSVGAQYAYTDFAYNLGVGALQKSRIPTLERSGRHVEACYELLKYVYSGKKFLPGLLTRRIDEHKKCLGY